METTKILLTVTVEQKEKIIERAIELDISAADYLRSLINRDLGIMSDGIKWGGNKSDTKG